jgi:hypothetical protein
MIYYKDTDNKIYAFEDNVKQETIELVEQKHNTTLTPISETEYKSFKLFGIFDKTEEEIEAKENELAFTNAKETLLNDIQSLADTKTKELKNYIAGKKVTPEQVDRYEQKYQLAMKCKEAGDYTPLNLEAELQGITGEELANLIIEKHDEWVAELQKYTALIEAYRVKAQTIVESLETLEDIEKAQTLLDKAK